MWFFLFKVVEDGYEFFAKRQLVTLFSAPNYCGEFDNAGGMMSVDETLMCSFQVSTQITPIFYKLSMLSNSLISVTFIDLANEIGITILAETSQLVAY